jgi:hypothetical protein
LLYTKDLKVNTIYVKDAARALWIAGEWRASKGPAPAGNEGFPILFNVVDHGDTRQENVAEALTAVFNIKVSFLGSIVSQFAKLNIDQVLDEMNELCLQTWADLIEEKNITRPGPIIPFLEKDVTRDFDMSIDGTLFETTTGFKPERERFDADAVRAMVCSYERMGWWP